MIERISLRARLVVGLVLVVALGLALTDGVIYAQLRRYLYRDIDTQLVAARGAVLRAVDADGGRGRPFGAPPAGPNALPPGTYGELRTASGTVLASVSFDDDNVANPKPDLPPTLATDRAGTLAAMTVGAAGDDDGRFRVVVTPITADAALVVAMPLDNVDRTLGRLLGVALAVTVGVLVILGAGAWWLVRLGLRPLERIEETAEAIAGGDLSRRVDAVSPRTEVGRLGLALNVMLTQIEGAFAERQASEERLRRFLADASHELRTPLTSIRGYAELFRRGASTRPEDLAKAMRRIEEEGARMGILVDDLLLLARLDQGRPLERAPVDLVQIARDAVADALVVHPGREGDVVLDVAVDVAKGPGQAVVVPGDDARLRQVAANLVGNALHHTPPGSSVSVRVGRDQDEAWLEVVDHGPGLSPEDIAHVFERFYRADPSRSRSKGGVGLGLAIVSAIAEAHGGRAEVSSVLGDGATFRVLLPVSRAAAAADASSVPH